mmetsp:Transcript_59378/g.145266  ORF Transcript_59378/g.145266 Transcript_59378/m.145266 type:complete len:276 (-) Transcript_59378:7732-8559(-)
MIIRFILSDDYWSKAYAWDGFLPRYEPKFMNNTLAPLLSKRLDFTKCDPSEVSQLPASLFAIGCELKVIKQILRILPKECRRLKFTEKSYEKFVGDYIDYLDYQHFFPTSTEMQHVIDVLPLLSDLEFEISNRHECDDLGAVLRTLATCNNLEKLSLRIAVEVFVVEKGCLDSLKNLILQTLSKTTDIRITFFSWYDKHDMYMFLEKEEDQDRDGDGDSLLDEDYLATKKYERVFEDAFEFLINVLSTNSKSLRVSGSNWKVIRPRFRLLSLPNS